MHKHISLSTTLFDTMNIFFMLIFLLPLCWNASNGFSYGGSCTKNISRALAERIVRLYPEKLENAFKNCASRCVKNRLCKQFSFSKGSCRQYTLGNAPIAVFKDRCNTNDDCYYEHGQCLEGLCACSIGYSHDFENNCIRACPSYGSSFSVYKNSGIDGCNRKVLIVQSLESCIQGCRNETIFVCINAEYRRGRCNLCDETWDEIAPHKRKNGTDKGWSLFYRHCQ